MSKFDLLSGGEVHFAHCLKMQALLDIHRRIRDRDPCTFIDIRFKRTIMPCSSVNLVRVSDEIKYFEFKFEREVQNCITMGFLKGQFGDLDDFSDYMIHADVDGEIYKVTTLRPNHNIIMMGWNSRKKR